MKRAASRHRAITAVAIKGAAIRGLAAVASVLVLIAAVPQSLRAEDPAPAAPDAADTREPNIDPAGQGAPGAAAQYVLAQQLYALGLARKNALSVVAAARLAAGVELKPAAFRRVEGGNGAPATKTGEKPATGKSATGKSATGKTATGKPAAGQGDTSPSLAPGVGGGEEEREGAEASAAGGVEAGAASPDAPPGPPDAAAMLASARDLAGEDEGLVALIEAAESAAAREASRGAMSVRAELAPGQSEVWEIPFFGGVAAELALLGGGQGQLTLRVADENGQPICQDLGWAARSLCSFVPGWNGYFFVTVTNTGTEATRYLLLTD